MKLFIRLKKDLIKKIQIDNGKKKKKHYRSVCCCDVCLVPMHGDILDKFYEFGVDRVNLCVFKALNMILHA